MTTMIPWMAVGLLLASTTSEPALRGLDPVRLCEGVEVEGSADLGTTHGRYGYRFADADSLARFRADPERWGIQWGGRCGRMGPLSGAGSPDRWAVHAGRIFIFASDACREGFLSEPERFVAAPAELPAFDEQARADGRAWLLRAVDAHGGAAALRAASSFRNSYEGTRDGWTQRLELVCSEDGGLERTTTWVPDDPEAATHETRWVLAREAFVDDGKGRVPLTSPDQLADLRRFAHREPIALLWASRRDDFVAAHLGAGELEGRPVENVLLLGRGLTTTLHLDPSEARILGLSWRGRAGDGRTRDVVELFTQWQRVDSLELPTARRVTVDGEDSPSLAIAWNRVTIEAASPAGGR